MELNIEQYEYMRGPNPGAGLKLQIHNQNDVPLVKEHGLAVPPGSHGFVAIKTIEVGTRSGRAARLARLRRHQDHRGTHETQRRIKMV